MNRPEDESTGRSNMSDREYHNTAASEPESEATAVTRESAMAALANGPRGAFIIAACAVGILFVGWLFFYFVLFMSRGYLG
jgi:hypothetical protein